MLLKKIVHRFCAAINYYYQAVSVHHQANKKVLKASYLVFFSAEEKAFLERCAYAFNYAVDYTRGFWQKEIYIVQLAAVTFLGNSGAVVRKDKLITESVFDQMRLSKSPAFRSPAWMWPAQKKGLYTSIMHIPWAETSNYHWFLDCLPRVYGLLQGVREPMKLIVPSKMPAFQRDTLNFLIEDRPEIQLVRIGKTEKWQLPAFVLPGFVSNHYSGYLPPEILHFIRTRVWNGYGVVDQQNKNRIYISRRKATKRRILSEEALWLVLQEHGFQEVFAEELTYKQQVQLFYNTELVVAPHGAGLTNLLFCRQVKVLELHPADIIKSHYFMLCKGLDFSYFYSFGSPSDEKLNFAIDVNDFALKVQYMCN